MLRRLGGGRACARIDSFIVDQHGLRKNGGPVRISRPAATDRDVEQHEEGMVVNPLRSLRKFCGSSSLVKMVVDVETDDVRFPLDSEDVEVVGKAPVARKRIRS